MVRQIVLLLAAITGLAGAASAQGPMMISGRVFDDTTGCPLRGVRITIPSTASVAVTDAAGRYRLGNPPGATISLAAALRGYATQQQDGITVSDSAKRVDFSLTRASSDSARGVMYPRRACQLEPRDSLPHAR